MAFTKIAQLRHMIASLPDRVSGQAQDLKAFFDANPQQLKDAFNALIDELQALTAADQIGFYPQEGITAQTVQSALIQLKEMLDEVVTGTIPDGSLTGDKLADSSVTAAKIAPAVLDALNGNHEHGNISAQGTLGGTGNRVVVTGTNGVLTTEAKNTAFNRHFWTYSPRPAGEIAQEGEADAVARGDHVHPSERAKTSTVLNNPLMDNRRYVLANQGNITLTYPSGSFECALDITFGNSNASVTFPNTTRWLGKKPAFERGKRYELSIVNGVAVGAEVGNGE